MMARLIHKVAGWLKDRKYSLKPLTSKLTRENEIYRFICKFASKNSNLLTEIKDDRSQISTADV